MTEVNDKLTEFEKLARSLNKESDSINSLLESVEQRLIAANAGIECWVHAMGNGEIGFAKSGSEWHLMIRPTDQNDPEFDGVLLVNTPRSTRIAALEGLAHLVDRLS